MVVGAERLAQAQHQRCDVVLHRVAHREAQRDADDPRTPQHRAQQRGRPDDVERDDRGEDHRDETDRARHQIGEEIVGSEQPPDELERGEQIAHDHDREADQQRHPDQRQHVRRLAHPVHQRGHDIRRPAQRGVARDFVLHRGDIEARGDGARFLYRLLAGRGAGQPHDAFVDVYLDGGKAGNLRVDVAQAVGDARIGLWIALVRQRVNRSGHRSGLCLRRFIRRERGQRRRCRQRDERYAEGGQYPQHGLSPP